MKIKIKNIFFPLVLLVLIFWTAWPAIKNPYWQTHDAAYQLSRAYDAINTFKAGQIPIRWAANLNYGCGIPVFNFYYPLINYLLVFFHTLGFEILLGYRLLIIISLVWGTVFFYKWMLEETNDKLASFVASALYLLVPYRFLLIYVRGNPEFLTYTILPSVLFFMAKTFNSQTRVAFRTNLFLMFLMNFFLLISHNIAILISFPFVFLYLITRIIQLKNIKRSSWILLGFLFSFFSASFFVLPALIESDLVKLGSTIAVNYQDHFPVFRQLIRSPWGWGYSLPGNNDGLSFQLGYAQWLVLCIAAILFLLKKNFWLGFYLVLSFLSVFLILPQSLFIWKHIPLIQQIQFPWRLLGIAALFASAVSAYLLYSIKSSITRYLVAFFILLLAIYGSRNHIQINKDVFVRDYGTTTIADEILSVNAASRCDWTTPQMILGDKVIKSIKLQKDSLNGTRIFELNQTEPQRLILALEYFPEIYHIKLNDRTVDVSDCSGRVCLIADNLKPGENRLEWNITQTRLENFFNIVSISSVIIWIALLLLLADK